ncbi:MAG TPA: endolytic transglycosylase MltG [Beijerinckiaceae bacterium]|nr:endolytic transglycosylase MltG [Beijerinckiaceae bacterium]
MVQSPKEALQPEAAPPPPKAPPSQRSPILSAASGVLSFILVAAIAAGAGLSLTISRLRAPGPLTAEKVVLIPSHTDVPDVISQLQREGVIDDGLLFNIALVAEGKRAKVKAGEYLFPQKATMQQVMDAIVSGRQVLHAITIPEGLTSEQIVQRLRADDVLAGDILKIPAEGSLHPETYKFVRGFARSDLIREMKKDENKVLQEVWANRAPDNPLKSPYAMLILASIVEKETGRADERPHVASVFLNRLKKGMKLQSDPTIVYGLVGGKGTLGAGITRAELMQPTPYNTYIINGLPPGPICNPGRAALEAVANPSQTKDLYFVADGTGGHVFAQTLAQHNKNVQHWREIEKEKAAAAPAIDRVPAQDLPIPSASGPRSRTRGDLEPRDLRHGDPGGRENQPASSIFGALPKSFASVTPFVGAPGGAFANLALAAPALNYGSDQKVSPDKGDAAQAPSSAQSAALDSTAESPAFTLAEPPPKGAALLDGPADSPAGDQANPASVAAGDAAHTPYSPPVNAPARVIDASEGTPLDPLKNKTWDLNSPKTVPTFN